MIGWRVSYIYANLAAVLLVTKHNTVVEVEEAVGGYAVCASPHNEAVGAAGELEARIHKVSATLEAWSVEEEEGLDLWGNLAGGWP